MIQPVVVAHRGASAYQPEHTWAAFTKAVKDGADAIECDVDCISDGQRVFIGGVMEHIEQAGVHSGDSACSLPPYSLSAETVNELRRQTALMAKGLTVDQLQALAAEKSPAVAEMLMRRYEMEQQKQQQKSEEAQRNAIKIAEKFSKDTFLKDVNTIINNTAKETNKLAVKTIC